MLYPHHQHCQTSKLLPRAWARTRVRPAVDSANHRREVLLAAGVVLPCQMRMHCKPGWISFEGIESAMMERDESCVSFLVVFPVFVKIGMAYTIRLMRGGRNANRQAKRATRASFFGNLF